MKKSTDFFLNFVKIRSESGFIVDLNLKGRKLIAKKVLPKVTSSLYATRMWARGGYSAKMLMVRLGFCTFS